MARADTRLEPAPKIPPLTALRIVSRIGAFVRPYRRQVVYAAVGLLFAAAAVLAMGQGLRFVVDRGFSAGDAAELDRMLGAMLAVIIVVALATYTRFYYVSWLGERVTADLRRAVFDHLLRLPPSFFEITRTGEVISRLTDDTTMLETIIGSSASMAIRNSLLMIGGFVMLMLTSVKLTLLVLAGVPLVVTPIILFGRRVRRLARASQDRVGDVGAYVDEALHEVRTAQAYGHEENDRNLFRARGIVSFDAVMFCYPSRPDTAALDDFSLTVRSGEKIALVGPSGAGKTTVFALLLRFYDPQRGVVRIDDVDLKAADPLEVRRRLAVVPQDPVIFAASVLENVRYGRPDASDAEVLAACEAAFASEFIERLPEGYKSFLGERGVRLSGGQRQRLAIARAILANRPVLLLDEATSALDAESERVVQLALERLMAGRPVLMIAHRLATVRHADRIAE